MLSTLLFYPIHLRKRNQIYKIKILYYTLDLFLHLSRNIIKKYFTHFTKI